MLFKELKEDKEKERNELATELSRMPDKKLRVLCYGPVDSGKSSFIDSIRSTLTGKMISKAAGGYSTSMTNETSKTVKVINSMVDA